MKPKDLNNNGNYNYDYNIVYSRHLSEKKNRRVLDLDKTEQTIINGRQVPRSKYPKICKKSYFGKENVTYFVVFVKTQVGIKVITAWKIKGK